MIFNEKLLNEITKYCEFNAISDIDGEANKMLLKGFNLVKFGDAPFMQNHKAPPKEIHTEFNPQQVVENVAYSAEEKSLIFSIQTFQGTQKVVVQVENLVNIEELVAPKTKRTRKKTEANASAPIQEETNINVVPKKTKIKIIKK